MNFIEYMQLKIYRVVCSYRSERLNENWIKLCQAKFMKIWVKLWCSGLFPCIKQLFKGINFCTILMFAAVNQSVIYGEGTFYCTLWIKWCCQWLHINGMMTKIEHPCLEVSCQKICTNWWESVQISMHSMQRWEWNIQSGHEIFSLEQGETKHFDVDRL